MLWSEAKTLGIPYARWYVAEKKRCKETGESMPVRETRSKSKDPEVQKARRQEARRAYRARDRDRDLAQRRAYNATESAKKSKAAYDLRTKEEQRKRITERLAQDPIFKERRRYIARKSANKSYEELQSNPVAYGDYLAQQRERAARKRLDLYGSPEPRRTGRKPMLDDINRHLAKIIRQQIRASLTRRRSKKQLKSWSLLGCSIPEFKAHLESKFTQGMSWNNYGEWEIDHILPVSSFNLVDEDQQRLCFRYQNLQPLWKSHNRAKGSKLNWSLPTENSVHV